MRGCGLCHAPLFIPAGITALLRAERKSPAPVRGGLFPRERRPEFLAACLLLVLSLLLGGSSKDHPWLDLGLQVVAGAIISGLLMTGRWRALSVLPRPVILLLCGILLLPVLQLVPLPPALWQNLPGHGVDRDIAAVMGTSGQWRPLSISPADTLAALAALLAPTAVFVLVFQLKADERRGVFLVILGFALLSACIGALQLAGAIDFAAFANRYEGFSTGLFANRNHQADFLIIGYLALGVWTSRLEPRMGMLIDGVAAAALIAAVAGTGSRFGLALALLTVLALALLRTRSRRLRLGLLVGGAAAAAALIMFSGAGQRVVGRFADLPREGRLVFWETGVSAGNAFLPLGSGLGAFRQTYHQFETLDHLFELDVNAAHNDYLELYVGGGLLAMVLVLGMLATIGVAARRVATDRGKGDSVSARIAIAVLAVLLLHSLVDYPLQTHALSCIFAAMLATLLRLGYPGRAHRKAAAQSL